MKDYRFDMLSGGGFFAVPCEVADSCLADCTGEQLKSLLLLLRAGAGNTGGLSLSAAGLTEEDFHASLCHWMEKGVLCQRDGALSVSGTGVCPGMPAAVPEAPEKKKKPLAGEAPRYTAQEIDRAVSDSPQLGTVLELCQQSLGKLLNFADTQRLFSFHDWLGLPGDVILMLVEFCVSLGKRNMSYIEKVAIEWADRGIDSMEKAEELIREQEKRGCLEAKLRSLFGLGARALSAKEKEYIRRWTAELSYDYDMIAAAYERTVNNTGKAALPYINSILESWAAKGYKTPGEAAGEKKEQKSQKQQDGGIDLDAYQKWSWDTLHEEG